MIYMSITNNPENDGNRKVFFQIALSPVMDFASAGIYIVQIINAKKVLFKIK